MPGAATEIAPLSRDSGRGVWLLAFLLTLLLHAVGIGALVMTRPFQAEVVQAKEPEPIQMVFQKPPDPKPKGEEETSQPQTFSELPEDRVDVAPEKAELLSNIDSRARDRTEGGQRGDLPQLQGESEAPHVAMREADAGAPEPASSTPALIVHATGTTERESPLYSGTSGT